MAQNAKKAFKMIHKWVKNLQILKLLREMWEEEGVRYDREGLKLRLKDHVQTFTDINARLTVSNLHMYHTLLGAFRSLDSR